ncbi:hypothetical protein EDB89DRAFT_1906221 [Lactarius sanguifluus]|nr:hypothetical protein EDB89DRAFT_1906221 [Lactarius sanguifluus]
MPALLSSLAPPSALKASGAAAVIVRGAYGMRGAKVEVDALMVMRLRGFYLRDITEFGVGKEPSAIAGNHFPQEFPRPPSPFSPSTKNHRGGLDAFGRSKSRQPINPEEAHIVLSQGQGIEHTFNFGPRIWHLVTSNWWPDRIVKILLEIVAYRRLSSGGNISTMIGDSRDQQVSEFGDDTVELTLWLHLKYYCVGTVHYLELGARSKMT